MPVKLLFCNDQKMLWEEYLLFLMRNYEQLALPYNFEMALSFIGSPITEGNALIVREAATDMTIGAMGYVYGTGANYFEDQSVCQIETIYIDQAWRGTFLFLKMIVMFAQQLERTHPHVEQIQFWIPADRSDLADLFSKFSTHIKTSDKYFGRISLYVTDTRRILS